jgi:flavorubredoxin
MQRHVLYNNNGLIWLAFARDPLKPQNIVDTNEYMIISGQEALLMDPGGTEVFPHLIASVSEVIDISKIKAFLCSHQDPDIMSSLPLWLGLVPNARIHLSWLWSGFVAHFGNEFAANFENLPDEGGTTTLGGREFHFIPAHHCHSPGNFHLFDPESRILFSGDVGAALMPANADIFVKDFNSHIRYMEKFHQRWMPSSQALRIWVERVRKLNPTMICPQHGAIFRGDTIKQFLAWLEDLEVGRQKRYA